MRTARLLTVMGGGPGWAPLGVQGCVSKGGGVTWGR